MKKRDLKLNLFFRYERRPRLILSNEYYYLICGRYFIKRSIVLPIISIILASISIVLAVRGIIAFEGLLVIIGGLIVGIPFILNLFIAFKYRKIFEIVFGFAAIGALVYVFTVTFNADVGAVAKAMNTDVETIILLCGILEVLRQGFKIMHAFVV